MAFQRIDETGNKYNHLTFINFLRSGKAGKGAIWILECDCGTRVARNRPEVIKGKRKTCGGAICPFRRALHQKSGINRHNTGMRLYAQWVQRASNSRVRWVIPPEHFIPLMSQPCAVCGRPECAGITRVDPREPYIPENVVPACTSCRMMQGKRVMIEFISEIHKIYEHIYIRSGKQNSA